MDDNQLHWLAGILEGEGSFLAPPPSSPRRIRVVIQMTDLDVIEKVALLMGGRPVRERERQKEHHKKSWATHVSGDGAEELMLEIRPLMGDRRKAQIDRALEMRRELQPPTRVLTEEQALDVVRRYKEGENVREMAKEFGVHFWTLYRIINGKTYQKVTGL